jgi:hypothetical protein
LNIGIGPALKKLVQYSKHELFMFLENDWLLVDRQPNLEKITIAAQMVTAGAQFVKLRNHVNPGLPMFSFAHIGNERASENLYALSDCIFWQGFEAGLNNPELQVIKLTNSNEHFLVTTSRFSNYTNNPAIYHRNFFNLAVKSHIRLGEQLEATIHDNWINSNHPSIAHMFHGPFTHNRLDR